MTDSLIQMHATPQDRSGRERRREDSLHLKRPFRSAPWRHYSPSRNCNIVSSYLRADGWLGIASIPDIYNAVFRVHVIPTRSYLKRNYYSAYGACTSMTLCRLGDIEKKRYRKARKYSRKGIYSCHARSLYKGVLQLHFNQAGPSWELASFRGRADQMRVASRVTLAALLLICLAVACEGASGRRVLLHGSKRLTSTGESANGSSTDLADKSVSTPAYLYCNDRN